MSFWMVQIVSGVAGVIVLAWLVGWGRAALRALEIASATAGDEGLMLRLKDPTLPRVRLALGAQEAAKWVRVFTSPLEGEVGSRSEPGGGSRRKRSDQPPSLTLPLKGGGDTTTESAS